MFQYLDDKQKKQFFVIVIIVLCVFITFLAFEAIGAAKQIEYIGLNPNSTNTITVNGTGSVLAVPDTAEFSFSVVADAKQMTDAQNSAATKTNAIIAALKAMDIADADIQTTGYNSYPTYTYQNAVCPPPVPTPVPLYNDTTGSDSGSASGAVSSSPNSIVYCPPGKQTLTGYEVSETLDVKVRTTSDSGTALSKVGSLGATNVSGLSFVIDNPDAVQSQARDKAIADAKSKAAHLSQVLGVKLNHIVNFSDDGSGPIYQGQVMSMSPAASGNAAVTPQIQTGQNKVTDNVSISYEVN